MAQFLIVRPRMDTTTQEFILYIRWPIFVLAFVFASVLFLKRWQAKALGKWKFVVSSILCVFVGVPAAATFIIPYSVGYIALPGTVISVLVASFCSVAFILCPRNPIVPKLATLILFLLAAQFAIDSVLYLYLHIDDMAGRVVLK